MIGALIGQELLTVRLFEDNKYKDIFLGGLKDFLPKMCDKPLL